MAFCRRNRFNLRLDVVAVVAAVVDVVAAGDVASVAARFNSNSLPYSCSQ